VEIGYLTRDGHLVVADTLGQRRVFKAYRIDERNKNFEFLGVKRPFEALGDVHLSVEFHRNGWEKPGEVVLRRTPAKLYRGRASHLFVGRTWRSLTSLHLLTADPAKAPTLAKSWTPPLLGISYPARGSPSFAFVGDASVRACRRSGATVELFATEEAEFTDFILSKLRVFIEFPSEAAAGAFSSHFPLVEDTENLDATVKIDIGRDPKIAWRKTPLRSRAGLVLAAILLVIAALAVPLAVRSTASIAVGGVLGTVIALGIGIALLDLAGDYREEILEFHDRWPRSALERFCNEAPGRAAGFAFIAREMGLNLDPDVGNLAPLDAHLRSLPAETFFAAMAGDAGAYVVAILLREIGRPVPYEWRYDPRFGRPVVHFPAVNFVVSPLHKVQDVWESKKPETLDAWVERIAGKVQILTAFQALNEFVALGFLDQGWDDFDAFAGRVFQELGSAQTESRVMGEDHYRVRRLLYPPFGIQYAEIEIEKRTGPAFVPLIAIPFCSATRPVRASLEGGSPRSPDREDVAVVRFEGYELVTLGVQIRNYLDVGPGFESRKGKFLVDLLAVGDEVRLMGPRLRAMRPEVKDFLAPMSPNPHGIPMSPYATFLGRIVSVGEAVNSFRGTPLWKLGLSIPGMPLEVLVRKDRCQGLPQAGHYATGSAWLIGDLEAEGPAATSYIR